MSEKNHHLPVTVRLKQSNTYTAQVFAGTKQILADEPPEAGGRGLGFTPYELLSSALGSCTAITLQMYALRKEWPLEEIIVTVKHEKRHAEDCVDCDNPNARIDHFDVDIEFVGPLSEEQKKRLLDISHKCPVHKTLKSETRVEIKALS